MTSPREQSRLHDDVTSVVCQATTHCRLDNPPKVTLAAEFNHWCEGEAVRVGWGRVVKYSCLLEKQHLFLGMASPTKKAAIHYNDDNGDVNEDDFEREGIENE